MNPTSAPPDEPQRIASSREDATMDRTLEDLTALAALICGTPLARIWLNQGGRQWITSPDGLDPAELRETELLFHASVPLITSDGATLGELSVSDHAARVLNPKQEQALRILGRQAVSQLELHRQLDELAERERIVGLPVEPTADASLRHERDFSDAVLHSLPGVLYLYDENGRFLRWNKNLENATGYTAAEIAEMHPLDFFTGLDKESVAARIGDVFRYGEAEVEASFVAKDGRVTPYYFTGIKALIEGRTCLVGVGIDITARRQAEDALRASEARYRTLFEYAPDGIVIANAESYYLDANASICRMLGYAREAFIGLHASDILVEDKFGRIGPALDEIKAQSDYHHEWQFRRQDGSVFPAEVLATLMPDGTVLGMIRDITERHEADERIHRLNIELEQRVTERTAQLESANHELEAFSYSVSHDLRAPLRAVNGFAGIVLDEFGSQLPAEARRYLERIRNRGLEMGDLIDDLLAFSRLSRQPLKRQEVDTAQLVQNALDDLAAQREGRQIELRVGTLPACWGDPALLKQVWVNLISNAIKYTRGREPAVIEIGCVREDGDDIYLVRDNGTGFDMRYVHKLFGVFQRLHRADEFEGTGVGLAIVQRIVLRHGGRVWAEAEEGRGAIFRFVLGKVNR